MAMTIFELINSQESARLAKYEKFSDDFIETICAMANSHGGTILLGLSSDGEILGIDGGEEVRDQWIQKIRDITAPSILPESEIHETESKDILAFHIHEAPVKPVAFSGRCFRRVGAENYLLSSAEVAQLHFQNIGKSWDGVIQDEVSLEDIDSGKVSHIIKAINEQRTQNICETAPVKELLEKLLLFKDGKLVNAALLLFGKSPQNFIPHARIKAGRFKSETLIIDDLDITGNIFEQIDKAFSFVQKHLTVRLVITGQPQREEVWDYPLQALREGIINAVCHRDYSVPVETQIRIYDDHLVIWNPGHLPNELSVDDLKGRHVSVLRNKFIGSVLYGAGFIEKWGSGTNRIISECKKLGLPEPEWREQQGLMLILRKEPFTDDMLYEQGLLERQIKAVAHVKKRRRITNQEYQQIAGVKKRTATEDLHQLEEKKIFERVGSTGKGTYYRLHK